MRVMAILLISWIAGQAQAGFLGFPHTTVNNIDCFNCHNVLGGMEKFFSVIMPEPPQNIDDTLANNLCWSCHNDVVAPFMKTHSSVSIDNDYGDWAIECRTCHEPHFQYQRAKYGEEAYLTSGIVTEVTETTLRSAGANWQEDEFAGLVLFSRAVNGYRIVGNSSDTLTLEGPIEVDKLPPGTPFAVIYGKLVRYEINTPNSGRKPVKLFRPVGPNTFADGDEVYDGPCEVCHTKTRHHRNNNDNPEQADHSHNVGIKCTLCHKHKNGFLPMGAGAHDIHVQKEFGPKITCGEGNWGCHGSYEPGSNYPNEVYFADGKTLCDGRPTTACPNTGLDSGTQVCANCHGNGSMLAKYYFFRPGSSQGESGVKVTDYSGEYTWAETWLGELGEQKFCGSCHNDTVNPTPVPGPASIGEAPNIIGDLNIETGENTYGFYVNGHGKPNDQNYDRLSWQDNAATGNPGAGRTCSDCHDYTKGHWSRDGSKRLKDGYENDGSNSICQQCHGPGKQADADPKWFTDYASYDLSAHGSDDKQNIQCSVCHDPHGVKDPKNPAAGAAATAMTRGDKEELCYRCHSDTGDLMQVSNHAVSGSALADDIEQAFNLGVKHNLNHDYSIGDKNYKLQCINCHNVHLVTGQYWEADKSKSPITRISTPTNPTGNLTIWGDEAGEKMDDYGGTYRTPKSDIFSGDQIPNYPAFCLDCHSTMVESGGHGGINWTGDPHGLQSANQPNGYGTCPNWYACGKASGWDGDLCVAENPDDCWPVITRSKGDIAFSRAPYNHEDRIAGANFALSCTDCHEVHGSGNSSMIRTNPNGGTGTVIWNTMCNNCHYYYSDWHAGMSCGNASCHVRNSIHRMDNKVGSGGTRTFNPDLVFALNFENNLKDSGTWQMDSQWFPDAAGSFVAGKSGTAIALNGDQLVQVGTENEFWSTDAGRHGTWAYTEMKFNTTQEAWINPTDESTQTEYTIFSKHVGYANGGYALTLKPIDGALRVVFNIKSDNNGTAQDGMSTIRGAYSSVAIPLNTWTHVAATFDTAGPGRDPANPSVGRIRIFVNGEDVTTSDASGNNMQPAADETSIFAYPENSGWNEEAASCYVGTWCAGEFAVGGFTWQNGFIGRIDEAKLWNITKDASYFANYDSQAAPYISSAEGMIDSDQLTVTFSEGVYASAGSTGNLVAENFILTDNDNNRTILNVNHIAGSNRATLTLSSALDDLDDFMSDTLVAAGSAIFDEHNLVAASLPVKLKMSSACPTGLIAFNLNELPGRGYAFDNQMMMPGTVAGTTTLTGSALSGDGISTNYINFANNTGCLQATTAMTVEARVKPTGIGLAAENYIRRILARDSGGNYQLSVWRNNNSAANFPNFSAPDYTASIALWLSPQDTHDGHNWKLVLSDYTACPITNDHWYQIKAVWNSNKPGGVPGQFFVPADIYIDDQGTDGNGSNENWAGYANCTNAEQSYLVDEKKLYTGDMIKPSSGNFAIGVNRGNLTGNLFNGLIDWISWRDTAD